MTRRRWSAGRTTAALLMATVWMATGVAVYLYLSAHRSTVADQVKKPGEGRPMSGPITRLPGALYIAQGGTMYRLQRGTFTPVLNAPGGASRWTQPASTPNGENLVVVRRDYASSDLYVIDTSGRVLNQLTHNANRTVEFNHWAFCPRLSPDGSSLFFSYDRKDPGNIYNVVLSVYSMPLTGNFNQAKRWTVPASYTGGDIQPIPLQSGGLIYTKYSFDEKAKRILSQIYFMTRSGAPGKPLTLIEDDCSQPAFSPDGQRLAMICTGGKQFANIEIAPFDGSKLGQRQVLVSGQLAAQPTWSPDGTSLVYLAPKSISGHFQLWLQPVPTPTTPQASVATPTPTRSGVPLRGAQVGQAAATPTPLPTASTPSSTPLPQPVQLTSDLDFDATSTIAWHG